MKSALCSFILFLSSVSYAAGNEDAPLAAAALHVYLTVAAEDVRDTELKMEQKKSQIRSLAIKSKITELELISEHVSIEPQVSRELYNNIHAAYTMRMEFDYTLLPPEQAMTFVASLVNRGYAVTLDRAKVSPKRPEGDKAPASRAAP